MVILSPQSLKIKIVILKQSALSLYSKILLCTLSAVMLNLWEDFQTEFFS